MRDLVNIKFPSDSYMRSVALAKRNSAEDAIAGMTGALPAPPPQCMLRLDAESAECVFLIESKLGLKLKPRVLLYGQVGEERLEGRAGSIDSIYSDGKGWYFHLTLDDKVACMYRPGKIRFQDGGKFRLS